MPLSPSSSLSPPQTPTLDINHTTSSNSDLSFTFDENQFLNNSANKGSDGDGGVTDDIMLNEEELKSIAQSLAPRVTSLLDSNEKVIENLINQNISWGDDDDDDNIDGSRNFDGGSGSKNKYKKYYDRAHKLMNTIREGHENNGANNGGYDDDDDDSGLEEDGKNLYRKMEEYRMKEEDGMEDEWNGLSNAEQMLRDELGMVSMGFNFVERQNEYDGNNDEEEYDSEEDEEEIEQPPTVEEEVKPKPLLVQMKNLLDEAEKEDEGPLQMEHTPLRSSANRQAYTLYDHAKYLDLQFSNADLGYPSCPLLTKEDAEALLDVPSFRHEMLTMENMDIASGDGSVTENSNSNISASDHTGISTDDASIVDDLQRAPSTKFKDKKSRMEAIREIMLCTREFVKPMSRSALSRMFEGLVDKKQTDLSKRKKLRKKQPKGQRGKNDQSDDDDDDRGVKITSANGHNNNGDRPAGEVLPVRTVIIQIRPDVLCGAVMDAVHTAIHSLRGEITRRQGNHLRALVPGCWVPTSSYMNFRPDEGDDQNAFVQILTSPSISPLHKIMNGMVFLPPFVVDAQLCTRKRSRDGERICLFRFFRIHEDQIVDGNTVCPSSPPHATDDRFNADLIPDLKECNTILRESSALFQRMRAVATHGGNIAFDISSDNEQSDTLSPGDDSMGEHESYVKQVFTSPLKLFSPSKERKKAKPPRRKKASKKSLSVKFQSGDSDLIQGEKAAQMFASQRLMNSFTAAPSVLDESENQEMEPIPSLSMDDWPFVQSSWRYITLCLNELDNRDLNYSSLVSCPFGAFPALPTLDVQLCSQIKALCKDNMITSLLKGAQELEEFARDAEYSCAKLIQLLQPTFLAYNLERPAQPEATPLASYPLDFTPPEVSCPPWGLRVVEALNIIAAKSPTADSGFLNDLELNSMNIPGNSDKPELTNTDKKPKTEFQKAREAASMVLAAFMKQEDEELSARLGRKNLQVMDRLAKMQAHKRDMIITIRDSYGTNVPATKYAKRIHSHSLQILRAASDNDETPLSSGEDFYPASDQVPLLTCRSISGKVPATCFVTCHQILLVTHPILGEAQSFMAKLSEIFVQMSAPKAKSLLNPMPSTVNIINKKDRKELFSFRPLMGARPLKEFVGLLSEIASESAEALEFSSRGGLLHIFNEKDSVEKAALGSNPSI